MGAKRPKEIFGGFPGVGSAQISAQGLRHEKMVPISAHPMHLLEGMIVLCFVRIQYPWVQIPSDTYKLS